MVLVAACVGVPSKGPAPLAGKHTTPAGVGMSGVQHEMVEDYSGLPNTEPPWGSVASGPPLWYQTGTASSTGVPTPGPVVTSVEDVGVPVEAVLDSVL